MGRLLCALCLGAALCLTPAATQVDSPLRQALSTGELIRIHVVADSDGERDQEIKYAVRDAVIARFGEALSCASFEEACGAIEQNLDAIEQEAARAAEAAGFTGAVEATFGRFAFPTRVYGGETVPAGEYTALRIVLGDGEGRNWWCVLYPAFCLIESGKDAAATVAQPVATPGEAVRWTSVIGRLFCREGDAP